MPRILSIFIFHFPEHMALDPNDALARDLCNLQKGNYVFIRDTTIFPRGKHEGWGRVST